MRGHAPGIIQRQWSLVSVLVILAGIFILQWRGPLGWDRLFMAVPAHVVTGWEHLRQGQFEVADLWSFGTLLSCAFLHADVEHIAFNSLALWFFAALVKDLLGHAWMIAIFVFTAITGALCHVIFNPDSVVPMLGASGAVMGFEGAYLGMAVRWSLPDPHVWPMARPIPPTHLAIFAVVAAFLDWTAIMDHSEENIAFAAHLGGFVGGMFLTSFIARMPRTAQPRH